MKIRIHEAIKKVILRDARRGRCPYLVRGRCIFMSAKQWSAWKDKGLCLSTEYPNCLLYQLGQVTGILERIGSENDRPIEEIVSQMVG